MFMEVKLGEEFESNRGGDGDGGEGGDGGCDADGVEDGGGDGTVRGVVQRSYKPASLWGSPDVIS